MARLVTKRAIFFLGGYEKKNVQSFFARCDREIGRFEHLWQTKVTRGKLTLLGEQVGQRRYSTQGENWRVETDLVFQSLDPIVDRDFDRPVWRRIAHYKLSALDYLFTGTAFRFIRHAWRFSIYFFYPIIMFWLAFAIALFAALAIGGTGSVIQAGLSLVILCAVFATLVKLGGNRYFVLHLMDLWSFSRDYIRGPRGDIDQLLDRYARIIADEVDKGGYDEVILVGHSTGGALMLDAAARARQLDPQITSKVAKFNIMTVGSTALKIGLHPAANWYRQRLEELFSDSRVGWFEFQCLADLINFYRTDPAKLMGLDLAPSHGGLPRPARAHVRMSMMVSPSRYKRMKGNFFRLHYQFVYGNTVRYFYDFFAICLGPAFLSDRAKSPRHFDKAITPPCSNDGADDGA